MNRVYSPTDTDKQLLCPRLRQLDKLWKPRGQVWTPNMALGTAIHAGLAVAYGDYHFARMPEALDAALASMAFEYQDGSEYTLDACNALVEKGLTEALKVDLVGDGEVLGVEMAFPHHRLDLVVRDAAGSVNIIDHKVTLKMDKGKQLPYRVLDYDPSWQLLQYAWKWREVHGECPTKSSAFLIILTPRAFTHLHSLLITDARLDDFATSARQTWGEMAYQDERLVTPGDSRLAPMNTRSCHAYNRPCDFYDGCHVYHGDQTMFPTLYDAKEPR